METIYPLKKPNKNPKALSIEPTPVHLTALLIDFPITIVRNRVKIKIVTPKPILLIKSDSIYSLITGRNLGTNIIVTTVEKTHFINEIRLKEKPLKKH